MDIDLIDSLINCTADFIRILSLQYEKGEISYDLFKSHAQTKLRFLRNHYIEIQDMENRDSINKTLTDCENIIKSYSILL